MRLDVDHEPGELADKLPALLARLAELAALDAEAVQLTKSARSAKPKTTAEQGAEFRFGPPRAMFLRGMKIAEARRARMASRVAEVLGVA